jgi:hypothetical protein
MCPNPFFNVRGYFLLSPSFELTYPDPINDYSALIPLTDDGSATLLLLYLPYPLSTECQAFSPVVRIVSSRPISPPPAPSRASQCAPFGSRRGPLSYEGTDALVL